MQRSAVSPGMARQLLSMIADTDLRAVLPTIRVPTLVIHQSDNVYIPVELGREVADLIPGERDDIEEFLTGRRGVEDEADRVLATVMFTDIVGSTEHASRLGDGRWRTLLDEHNEVVRHALERWRGNEI